MRSLGRLVIGCAFTLALAAPAAAQRYDAVAGYGGGIINFGAFNPDAGGTELRLRSGWVVTAFGEGYGDGGMLGVRVNGAFTQRPLEFAGGSRDISTWMIDLAAVLRPLGLAAGRPVSPFLAAGGGMASYGLGRSGRPVVVGDGGVVYPGNDERQWMVMAGAGVDAFAPGLAIAGTPLGLRFEVADHVVLRSPFETLDGGRIGPIHNIRLGVSLIGLGR